MPIIGITGGIASGKSLFCRQLPGLIGEEAESFDADASAHQLLAHDAEVRRLVTEDIHAGAYGTDGEVNRPLLRETVFRHPEKKRCLENILHPRIRRIWTEQGRAAAAAGKFFLVDIPLLFETGAESFFDRIVTVACAQATQRQRLIGGRKLTAATADRMIASQMPTEEKMSRSHHVVWNDGALPLLKMQATIFAQKLHERSG